MKMNKYIKKFNEVFNLTDEISKNALDEISEISDSIKIYNSRKSSLKNLIMSNIFTDKNISKNIEDIVKDNKFLKMYLVVLNSMASLEKIKKSIDDAKSRIADKKVDLAEAATIDDQSTKTATLTKLNKDITDINKKIQEYNSKLSQMNKDILTKENELKKKLSDEEKSLRDKLNKIKTS